MTSRALSYVLSHPWAITREGLETIVEVAGRFNGDLEAIEKERGAELRSTESAWTRDGVAVVPVHGPIVRYGNLFSRISGASSLEIFARDFSAAVASPEVKAIIIEGDSPGGGVNGISETTKLIREARKEKPVHTYISYGGASGMYWLASAAEKIWTADISVIGSIGAILQIVDFRKAEEKAGVQSIDFVSSVSPRKRPDPLTDSGAAQIQAFVDAIGRRFVEDVARNRGITPEQVLSDYGRGDVFVGSDAVSAGLADGVTSLEDLIAELSERSQRPAAGGSIYSGSATQEDRMDPQEQPPAGDQPEATKDPATQASPAVITQTVEALEEHYPALVAVVRESARVAGATAERDRILGIQALHGMGNHPKLRAELVGDPSVSVEAAAHRLIQQQGIQGEQHLKQRADAEGSLEAPSGAASPGDEADEVTAAANLVLTAGRQVPLTSTAGQEG